MSDIPEKLLSAREAAVILGISKPTLCRLMQRGQIGFYRVGARVLFNEEHISGFLKSCEQKPLARTKGAHRDVA